MKSGTSVAVLWEDIWSCATMCETMAYSRDFTWLRISGLLKIEGKHPV